LANQALQDAFAHVTLRNLQWQRNELRWQFLLESYMGGEEYRRGRHLTRYALETDAEYQQRLGRTPYDNHCRSVIQTYISFLFREPPQRDLGTWSTDPQVQQFLRDADFEGRDLDSFMKEAATWAAVFGHSYILMTKPNIGAATLGEELEQGVRPYVNILTPLVVVDWQWQRQANGRYQYTYFKYIEDVNDSVTTVREWTPEVIRTYESDQRTREARLVEEEPNGLGMIPVVILYNHRSQVRGIGVSAISDIADQCRAIYNELSEVEQSIRLEGHPSLVVTPDTQVGSGAGAMIIMPETLDPGLRPFTLTTDGVPVDMIYKSIQNRVASIDKMAMTGAVRGLESRDLSGVAMEVEFQLLNAMLSEMADNIELAEEQMWQIWGGYQDQTWTGEIHYPDSFAIRDTDREINRLKLSSETVQDPRARQEIDRQVLEYLGHSPESAAAMVMQHPTTTPEDRTQHIQEMIMQGLTDTEILALHAEITQADIDQAREQLLTSPGE
jgi:hypothetical protein